VLTYTDAQLVVDGVAIPTESIAFMPDAEDSSGRWVAANCEPRTITLASNVAPRWWNAAWTQPKGERQRRKAKRKAQRRARRKQR
jgi:hypothetical protein